jgi:DNA-binding transcriptional MerR regulator
MFSIGDFARLGRVSIRMLRHYDALGLLRPAHVDERSGYRSYQAAQLPRLNRIVALKDLGFTLHQVQTILDEDLAVSQLQGMLRLRRAELEAGVAADLERLARVEARLSLIESEGLMPINEVLVKQVPRVRVAELRAVASGYEPEAIGPVIGPLFGQLCQRLDAEGLTPAGPQIAYYEPVPNGVMVHASSPVTADPPVVSNGSDDDLALVDLPAIEAATIVYRGSMDKADAVVQELARWIEANGYRGTGHAREVYLACPPDHDLWVTEFQEPVVKDA